MSKAKIENLFEHRKTVQYRERQLGLSELNDNEKATLEFIASRDGTRIRDIMDESYFIHQSLSTVKRQVMSLRDKNLIKVRATRVGEDKRDRNMILV